MKTLFTICLTIVILYMMAFSPLFALAVSAYCTYVLAKVVVSQIKN